MGAPSNNRQVVQGHQTANAMRQLPVILASPLPPLYAAWMDQLLAGPIPSETDATCDDCAMLPANGASRNSDQFFNPETKCCSYIPRLPNYLVGNILADQDPAFASGRATVESRLNMAVGVTPLGMDHPPHFQVLYGQSRETLFGQSSSLRCPHYLADEGGRCGVWKYRAAVCATWYCKYVRGQAGQDFWSTIHQLLSAVENSLSRWCVLNLEVGSDALRQLFTPPSSPVKLVNPRALDGLADPTASRILWGNWAGREQEFYRECARTVNTLDWPEVVAICGPEIKVFARMVCDAYARLMSDEIPVRLIPGSIRVIGIGRDSYRITSYNNYDPLSLPKQLVDLLGYFDGRPTDAVLKLIAAREGVTIKPELVRKLADFGVLVPVT